jgi:enterochelin esterase-like enzyme
MKSLWFIFSVLLPLNTIAQSVFHDFLLSLDSADSKAKREEVIAYYLPIMEEHGIPFIEGDTANFIYTGDASVVVLAGDFNEWSGSDTLIGIDSTNFFYHRGVFEQTARLDYKFIVDGNWILDPKNPNTCSGGYGPNSELAMPGYVQPWEIKSYPATAKGSIATSSFHSTVMNKNYQLQIYLPPGYDNTGHTAYPSIYVQDGQEYISLGGMNNVIDNLLDSNKIDPIIRIFIRPANRNEEYGFTLRYDYEDFIIQELVPYIDANYPTIHSPAWRMIMGTSLGANVSGLTAYEHTDVFGNCGLHSPAFWVNDFEVSKWYTDSTYQDVKLYWVAGTYEDLGIDWASFTDSLDKKGYTYDYNIYHEGHSWGLWRATCDEMLTWFFPKGSAPLGIQDVRDDKHILGQNYPNPFSGTTTIPLTVTKPGIYTLRQYDSDGRLVQIISERFMIPGDYRFDIDAGSWSPGVYYYSLISPDGFSNRSMMVLK